MFGFLNINKPPGVTSRDVVNQVQRLLPRKTKIGHAGTLDPMATGVLVLCIGPATRLVPWVQELRKSYRAGFRLGCRSDTDDSTGKVVETPGARPVDRSDIGTELKKFLGRILQTPPQFSALHVDGKRAYDLARAGQTVDLAPREVEIFRIELLHCEGHDPEVDIDCSSGTYIRSIARDLGEALEVGGMMTSLVRTAVGPFRIDSAITLDSLTRENIPASLLPPTTGLAGLFSLTVSDAELREIRQGKSIPIMLAPSPTGTIKALDRSGHLIALGEYHPESQRFQPRTVFGETP
jgi:tRNA pseudouridine55 synthase